MSHIQTFEQVYTNCSLPLRRFISKRLGHDQQLVDDVLQETFLAAYKGWDTFQNKSKYLTWLCKISLNKMADYYRKNIHENSRVIVPLAYVFDQIFSHQLTPEEQTVLDELRGQVKTCLNLIPPDYKQIIELRYFKHYSYEKIADVLALSERSVEGRLYRARKAMLTVWDNQSYTQSIQY